MTNEECPRCGKVDPAGLKTHLWKAHGVHWSEQAVEDMSKNSKPVKSKKLKKKDVSLKPDEGYEETATEKPKVEKNEEQIEEPTKETEKVKEND